MKGWSPQLFEKQAKIAGLDPSAIANALASAAVVRDKNSKLPPVFSLRHLADHTDIDYGFLRAVVSRRLSDPYRTFQIHKRPSFDGDARFRTIAVPNPFLMEVQRWICRHILSEIAPHSASVAYSKGNTIFAAAEMHCGSRWLIKMDIKNFFESINEVAVYRVFRRMGYQPLPSFEMTRICTRVRAKHRWSANKKWQVRSDPKHSIPAYRHWEMGHLPQGAPTSPMLANLAARQLDLALSKIANASGLIYSRYADDLTFSTDSADYTRGKCAEVISKVYGEMRKLGFTPNLTKTLISPPGARKLVLGLLVDGSSPKLTRDFKNDMRRHIHYLTTIGPVAHAKKRKFVSLAGMRNHIDGLLSYAKQIEPAYGQKCQAELMTVEWPL